MKRGDVVKRGEVWMVDLDATSTSGSQPQKMRPALIMTLDPLNAARHTVVVVPLSTSPVVRPPLVVSVASMGEHCVAVCDQIRTVNKSRLMRRMCALDHHDIESVSSAVKMILGV